MGCRVRKLHNRLGMSQDEVARAFGISLANIRRYDIGRAMPPPVARAYLKAIAAQPELAAKAWSISGTRSSRLTKGWSPWHSRPCRRECPIALPR
ncbi:MAG: helix-turn-helix domain-containing protein [Blastomonas sp.]